MPAANTALSGQLKRLNHDASCNKGPSNLLSMFWTHCPNGSITSARRSNTTILKSNKAQSLVESLFNTCHAAAEA